MEYVNTASGRERHRFHWLAGDHEIGALPEGWNQRGEGKENATAKNAPLLHWTLGGPWFKAQRTMGDALAAEWFVARDEAFRLFE